MRARIAGLLRRVADWLEPPSSTERIHYTWKPTPGTFSDDTQIDEMDIIDPRRASWRTDADGTIADVEIAEA